VRVTYIEALFQQRGAKLLGQRRDRVKCREPLGVKGVKKLARPKFGLPIFLCNTAKLLIIKA
jgi:hypothetical protein